MRKALIFGAGFGLGGLITALLIILSSAAGCPLSAFARASGPDLSLAGKETQMSRDAQASLLIEPCFARPARHETDPPVWMSRPVQALNPAADKPNYPVPDLASFPGLVKIEQIVSEGGNLRHHCAATRIAEHWFVTAGHCVRSRGTETTVIDMILIAPRVDMAARDALILPVDQAVCHKAWLSETGKFDDDIALLYIENVHGLSGLAIAKREMQSKPLSVASFRSSYFAGWGKTGGNRFLQGGPINVTQIGELLILADNQGQLSPCVGDSGGPLFVNERGKPRLAGVLSSVTSEACPPFGLAFYVRIKPYDHWIENVIRHCVQKGRFVCQ